MSRDDVSTSLGADEAIALSLDLPIDHCFCFLNLTLESLSIDLARAI